MSPSFWQYHRYIEINITDNRHLAFVYLLGKLYYSLYGQRNENRLCIPLVLMPVFSALKQTAKPVQATPPPAPPARKKSSMEQHVANITAVDECFFKINGPFKKDIWIAFVEK